MNSSFILQLTTFNLTQYSARTGYFYIFINLFCSAVFVCALFTGRAGCVTAHPNKSPNIGYVVMKGHACTQFVVCAILDVISSN